MMAERTIQITIKASDQTGSAVGKVESAFGGLQKKLETIGGAMMKIGGAMSLALTAPLVAIGKKSIDAASDLSESMNKVEVVFGDAAASVIEFSENAATALGQSQQQALEAVGTFGNLFTAMGLGQDVSAEMSIQLVQLASDLASFNNIDPTVALEKLRAGLVGEAEPLRTLGVNISAVATEAKAMELGLIAAGEEMTPAAKAAANFALILEQTTNAQGDFARTSDGLANSNRILKAQLADVTAQIGNQLLPMALKLTTFLNDLIKRFSELSPETQKVILIIAGAAAAIGPLLVIIGSLTTALSAIIPVVAAVAGVLTFPLIAIIAAVGLAIAALYLAWKNNWGGIQEKTKAAIDAIKEALDIFFLVLRQFMKLSPGDFPWEDIFPDWIANRMYDLSDVFEKLRDIIIKFFADVKAWWAEHGDQITEAARVAWEYIQEKIGQVLSIVSSIFAAFKSAFEGDWYAFGENLRDAWDKAWELIAELLRTAWANMKEILRGLITSIITLITTTDWPAVGRAIIDGIKNGVVAVAESLGRAVVAAAKAALDAAKGFLGIKSPSLIFMEIGESIVEGLIAGIKAKEKTLFGTIQAILETASQFGGIAGGFVPFFERDVLDPIQREIDVWQERIDATSGTLGDMFDTMAEQGMDATSALENALQTMDIGQLRNLANALRSLPPDWLEPGLTQRAATNLEYMIGLIHQRNILEADYAAEQERILALQQQQQDLAFLQQQLELLDLIREHQLDPEAILGGMQLGLDAELSGILEAMTRAMQELIAEAEAQLGIASPSRVFERLGNFIMGGLARGIGQGTSLLGAAFRGAIPQMINQATGSATTNNLNLTIHSNARTEDVLANFELMKALAGT